MQKVAMATCGTKGADFRASSTTIEFKILLKIKELICFEFVLSLLLVRLTQSYLLMHSLCSHTFSCVFVTVSYMNLFILRHSFTVIKWFIYRHKSLIGLSAH